MATINLESGYHTHVYTKKNGKKVLLHIFKTDPSEHWLAGGLSTKWKQLAELKPDFSICSESSILAKTNGNYQDPQDSGRSFYGIWLAGGILAKDGKMGITVTDPVVKDFLGEGQRGWHRYSPSLCIDFNGAAKIHWFSTQSGGQRITVAEGIKKYNVIIPGQHCLVHNRKSVFEQVCYSWEGVRIADWNNLESLDYHQNSDLGGGKENVTANRARTLLGHAPDGSCYLIAVVGKIDWGKPQENDPGMNLKDAAQLMLDLGCDYALNMDGGKPTQMYVKKEGKKVYENYPDFPIGSAVCVYEGHP